MNATILEEGEGLLRPKEEACLTAAALRHCNDVVQEVWRTQCSMHPQERRWQEDRMRGLYPGAPMVPPPRIEKLEPGFTGDSSRCVIAKTIANATGCPVKVGDTTEVGLYCGRPLRFGHYGGVDEFISAFDNHRIPSLDANVIRAKKEAEETKKLEEIGEKYDLRKIKCEDLGPAYPDWTRLYDTLPDEVNSEGMAEAEAPCPA